MHGAKSLGHRVEDEELDRAHSPLPDRDVDVIWTVSVLQTFSAPLVLRDARRTSTEGFERRHVVEDVLGAGTAWRRG